MADNFSSWQVELAFKNVCYEVPDHSSRFGRRKRGTKVVLQDVNGIVKPGDIVALMGASGAGKTSLLNLLSCRVPCSSGTISLNGKAADAESMAANACVIQQEDHFFGHLTVEEHLLFQARLRVPMKEEEQRDRVKCVIQQLGLSKSASSAIGNVEQGTKRGVSGGEKKRLSVATNLLTNPALIFADEPTSGLDAYKAESVVLMLKALAGAGHTVICTIHQPSSDVFALFNKVMLLSEGRQLYFGPRMGVLPYFLRLGHPCPPYTNPADFLIELVGIDWDNPDEKLEQLRDWSETWHTSGDAFLQEWEGDLQHRFLKSLGTTDSVTLKESIAAGADGRAENREGAVDNNSASHPVVNEVLFRLPTTKSGKPLQVSRWGKFTTVFRRALVATSRNPSVVRARLIQALVTSFLGGMVYLRLDSQSWYSKSGAVFFMMINQAFMATFTALMAFVAEKKVILPEVSSGLYTLEAYFGSKLLSDLVFQFHLPVLYTSICWYLMGLNDDPHRFVVGMIFNWLTTMACSSIGYLIGAVAPSPGVAVALGPIVVLPCLLVSGFVVQKAALPHFWLWLYHLSPFVYANSALMRAVFLHVDFHLTWDDVDQMDRPLDFAFRANGDEVLRGFGLSTAAARWKVDILGLVAWAVFGRLLAGVLFVLINRFRRAPVHYK